MIIQSKVDVAIIFVGIIAVGILGGLLSTFISDWRYSTMNTPTNPELTKGQKKKEPIKEEILSEDVAEVVKVEPKPAVQASEPNDQLLVSAMMSASANAANIRYVDGERQWSGGDEFLEGLKFHLNKELVEE